MSKQKKQIAASALVVLGMLGAAMAGKPNVVLFLADDLGWRDVSYMGSRLYQTPHIDQLAADGMLIKRPILDLGGAVLVGFKEADWDAALS